MGYRYPGFGQTRCIWIYGTYDPNTNAFMIVNFSNYKMIVLSATTEGYISLI